MYIMMSKIAEHWTKRRYRDLSESSTINARYVIPYSFRFASRVHFIKLNTVTPIRSS